LLETLVVEKWVAHDLTIPVTTKHVPTEQAEVFSLSNLAARDFFANDAHEHSSKLSLMVGDLSEVGIVPRITRWMGDRLRSSVS
jgi:hypothetical protein